MIEKKTLEELDEVDKIIFSLNNITHNLYSKAKDKNLDPDTVAFLIYNAENLEKIQLDLKENNIEFIKKFIPYTSERSRLLCDTMAEKSQMEKSYDSIRLEIINYLQDQVETDVHSRK